MAIFALLALTSGAVTGTVLARKATQPKQLFAQLVPPQVETVVLADQKQTALTRLRRGMMSDSRQQYQQDLSQSDVQTDEGQAHEQAMRRSMGLAVLSLGLATGGVMGAPLLFIPSAFCSTVAGSFFFTDAYQGLVREGKFDQRAMYALSNVCPLLIGAFWSAGFGTFWGAISYYLAAKTENRSKQTIANLFGGDISSVWLLIDGQEIEVPIERVQIGDVVVVQAGQMVPVDGTIVRGVASIDQHMLTGESKPIEKEVGDPVMTSTVVLSGNLQIEVTQAGDSTVAAQITRMLSQTTDFRANLQSRADRFASRITLPMLGLSALALPINGVASAVTVLWCYPGFRMLLYGPLSMLSHLQLAAQQGILIKDGRSLEQIELIDTVVFDKTGTLTLEQPTLGRVFSYNGHSEHDLLRYTAAAETKQSHPIALAILQAARTRQIDLDDAEYKVGYGLKVQIEGRTVRVSSQRFMELEQLPVPPAYTDHRDECEGLGHSLVLVAVNDTVAGAIELQPTIRPEAADVVAALHQRGVQTVIISGDQTAPTRRLAAQLGIEQFHAEVLPEDKANLVQSLQAEGRKVCFVGDGINDAIALKTADVSISLLGATTIATDVAQIVFMDGTLNQLPPLFALADDFSDNMRVNEIAATAPNVLAMAGVFMFGWGILIPTLLMQTGIPVALYNTIRPLLKEPNPSS